MKIVLAPDSFKESMSAHEAALAMERGVRAVFPDAQCVRVPMADGGEGTTEALVAATGGELVEADVHDALGRPIRARYGYVAAERLAIVEVAAAAGIDLVAPHERDPLRASSAGVGELLLDALDRGATRLVVGLGGSVTNDGGAGMMQALGVRLRDGDGADLPGGGGALARLASLDLSGLDRRVAGLTVEIASDVTNPLLGPEGASAVFGPQKGATPRVVDELDAALHTWARAIADATGRAVADEPGAGAAGGLGAAFLAFFPATMSSGVDVVVRAAHLEEKLDGADLVLTGEGAVDSQTLRGKTPFGVARAARRHDVPVIAFAGYVGDGAEVLYDHGFAALVPIVRSVTDLPAALADGPANLRLAVETVCRVLALRS
ncbi:glycerate kinase [Georgenia sp. SYP-B2076]|uniref:glycerate kinase n=1 Tax=Georgenia sp. SYP-B2076 TaxID=2495881 RepID=UPI000F8E603B|nr:glycerate kinase [Georgenia sp. SYP-B2076]